MSAGIDWNDQSNKVAAGVMIAGFVLLAASAFNPLREAFAGTPLWAFRAVCIAAIAWCVYRLFTPSAIVMLFLGFSAGIPILLILSLIHI